MQLSPYIKDLLYRYECVIIPGFGAFLANYTSASIQVDSSTFYPQGKPSLLTGSCKPMMGCWLIILLLTEDLLNPGLVVPACDCVDSLATLVSATE